MVAKITKLFVFAFFVTNLIEARNIQGDSESPRLGDVVEVAVANGNFKTLVQLLTDLKLVDTLKGMTEQTIFAPSDEAFAKLPEGTLDGLTPEQKLTIVSRHVIANLTLLAAGVTTGPVKTLGGESIDLIKTDAGGVQISYMGKTVNVVTADVEASNGIIHVIDEVILPAPLGDVVEVAIANGNFKTLVQLLTDLNLVDALKGMTAQTIFAPSDEAFAKLPEGTLGSLTPEQALAIVSRHVVANATVHAADVTTGPVKTLGGEMIDLIKTDSGGVQILYMNNTVNVVTADVMASNGVIHVIDQVILPKEKPALGDVVDVAVANGNFTTLVKLLTDLKLVDALKGMTAQTIFAPSDEAFAKLPEGTLGSLTPEQALAIVSRHVVANVTVLAADVTTGPVKTLGGESIDLIKTDAGGVQISYMGKTVNVVTADVEASNGIIHVIDEVILPAPLGDVVEVAIANGNFKTLVQLLTDLNLVDALKGMTAQTIFAPSDEAFAKLPEGTLGSLTPEQALAIVSRHVVANATVHAADVTTGPVKTLGGEMIDLIKTDSGGVQILYMNNTVNVVTADVMASNGVIHVIDQVILPKEKPALGDVVDVAVANGNFTTLVKLLTDLKLVDALKGMTAQTIFAPSDEAFAKLPEGTLDDLTPEQKTAIVQRHVIADVTVLAADVKPDSVVTLSGESIDLIKTEAGVKISYEGNTVNVVLSDVMASNGVIHVINKVILPEETQKDPIAQIGEDGTVTLVSGIRELQLEFNTVSNVQAIRLDVTKTDASNNHVMVNEIIPKLEHGAGKL